MFCSGDHIIFKNRLYEKASDYDAPLVEGKVAKMGLEKNVRPVGDSIANTSMMLQLDGLLSTCLPEEKNSSQEVAVLQGPRDDQVPDGVLRLR